MTKLTIFSIVSGFAALIQAVQLTNENYSVTPGEPFTIEWTDAQGPVTLLLKSGPETALVTVEEITSGQTGESFTWNVPANLAGQYAIEIQDASGEPNYSPQFPIGDGSQSVLPTTTGAASPTTSAGTLTPASTLPTSGASSATGSATTSETSTDGSVTSTSTGAESSTNTNSGNSTAQESTASSESTTSRRPTRSREPSATESEGGESQVPDSGAAGNSGGALFGLLAALALVA